MALWRRRRRVGSNQYQERWGPDLPAPSRDQQLVQLALQQDPTGTRDSPPVPEAPEGVRCGEVWGTGCRAWVGPPDYTHGSHPGERQWRRRAQDPECPPWLHQLLLADPERRGVALANPLCDPQVLAQAARDPDWRVRAGAGANPRLPQDLLRRLAGDPAARVRQAVAANPACCPQLLELLAGDPSPLVVEQLVRRPDCPKEALAQLVSREFVVRRAIVQRPDCPPQLLEQLAEDPDREIRVLVADNPNCSRQLWLRLLQDPDEWVRGQAVLHLDLQALQAPAPRGNQTVQQWLLADPSSFVRAILAMNPNCPPQALEQLAASPDPGVRGRVALRPDCPPQVLVQLARDPVERVREAAVGNPSCPPQWRALGQL